MSSKQTREVSHEESDYSSMDEERTTIDCHSKTAQKQRRNFYKINSASEDWSVKLKVNGSFDA